MRESELKASEFILTMTLRLWFYHLSRLSKYMFLPWRCYIFQSGSSIHDMSLKWRTFFIDIESQTRGKEWRQDISDTSLHRTDVRDPSHLIQRRVFIPRNWNRRIEGGPNDWPSLYVTKLESSDGYFRRKKVIVMIEPSTEQTNAKVECDGCICVCMCMKRALKN